MLHHAISFPSLSPFVLIHSFVHTFIPFILPPPSSLLLHPNMQLAHDEEASRTETLDTLDTPNDTLVPVKESTFDRDSVLGAALSDSSTASTTATAISSATTIAADTTIATATTITLTSSTDIVVPAAQEQETGEDQPKQHPPVFEGDGQDPYNTTVPERTVSDWIAYTVSLNYNRVRKKSKLFRSP